MILKGGFKIAQSITDRQDASLELYFKDVSQQPMISSEEEICLTKEIKKGNETAVKKLVEANLRFVISVAKQYQNKGIPLVDLIQEGNFGLIKAAKLYDETKGFKFISYAVWWIRQAIMKAISNQCRTVRIPMNQIVYINRINKSSEKFEQVHERKPTSKELEEITDINSDRINLILTATNRTVSLESPIKDEDANCLLDILPDDNQAPTDNYTIRNELSGKVRKILAKLSYRDRDIIRMSFGIGMYPMPNEEIAKRFGISSERVRQIQHTILNNIKKRYSKELKNLL